MRSAVVLPEPDGPTSTMSSPSAMCEVERVDRGHVGARVDARRLLEADVSHRSPPSASAGRRRPRRLERRPRRRARPEPRVGASAGAERVEPEQRRADDRRRVGRVHDESGPTLARGRARSPPSSRRRAAGAARRRARPRRRSPVSPSRVERDPRERDDLVREPVDDLGGDRVVGRLGEDERRELDHAPLRDPPRWIASRELERRRRGRSAPARAARGVVRGPRPSSLRAAAETAARPTS